MFCFCPDLHKCSTDHAGKQRAQHLQHPELKFYSLQLQWLCLRRCYMLLQHAHFALLNFTATAVELIFETLLSPPNSLKEKEIGTFGVFPFCCNR